MSKNRGDKMKSVMDTPMRGKSRRPKFNRIQHIVFNGPIENFEGRYRDPKYKKVDDLFNGVASADRLSQVDWGVFFKQFPECYSDYTTQDLRHRGYAPWLCPDTGIYVIAAPKLS